MPQSNMDLQKKVLVNSWRVFEKWESKSNKRKLNISMHEKARQVIELIFLFIFTVIFFLILLTLFDLMFEDDYILKIFIIIYFVLTWMKIGIILYDIFKPNEKMNSGRNKKRNTTERINVHCVGNAKENEQERTNHHDN